MMVVAVMVVMPVMMMRHLSILGKGAHAGGGEQGGDQDNQDAFHGVSPIGIQ
jgi:hypothetical protein